MNVIHWSSSAPKQVIFSSKIDPLMTMVSQKQQYFQSFALNQSHDRKWGGGMMWSRWIQWWSMSWIDQGGYNGSLGALNSAKYPSCLPLSCWWICFSPKNMYSSGEPSKVLRLQWHMIYWELVGTAWYEVKQVAEAGGAENVIGFEDWHVHHNCLNPMTILTSTEEGLSLMTYWW